MIRADNWILWVGVGVGAIVLFILLVAVFAEPEETVVVRLGGEPFISIEPGAEIYEEAKALLEAAPDATEDELGWYDVGPETYAAVSALLPPLTSQEQEELDESQRQEATKEALWNQDWSLEELSSCSSLPDQTEATVCEAFVMSKQLETMGAIREMSDRDQRAAESHMELVDAIGVTVERVTKDKVIDRDELRYICDVAPQWQAQLQEAQRFVESKSDMLGLEIDVYRASKLVGESVAACNQ